MQGLHHQQQQLAALLSVALSSATATSATAADSTVAAAAVTAGSDSDESNRLAAVNSLHRLIVYPPNSLLVTHSASFLSQGFSQLLSDKSYSLRQSAATAYGALCSVLSSIPLGSRQSHVVTLVDRFINWALPLLSNVSANDSSTELALESLREFLSVGDVGAIERYAFPILKACQELLEDERTSMNLLHQLLAVLTVISMKFFRCFQPHFIDIVDLLLGWAMVPDLAEGDRRVIVSSFLQFQKYWVSNLQFPLSLLSKFLGDMDMLLQDGSAGTPQQFQRLLALFSCFSAVLQSTASGLLEINRLEQIIEPLSKMIPQLLGCLSLLGKKFGWSKWLEDSWRCLTLLAEILGERFSNFYTYALDVLFESLDVDTHSKTVRSGKVSSFQIHGVLKTNLQLLSLQKLGLHPASVHKILQWDAPISQLRLHPNHLVTSSAAATYVFLLQHGNDEVVEHSINILFEELQLVKGLLEKDLVHGDKNSSADSYSRLELCALFRFDLKVLLTCICLGKEDILSAKSATASLLLKRSEKLALCVVTKLSPFHSIKDSVELQVTTLEALAWITSVELLSKCSIQLCRRDSSGKITNISVNDKQLILRISKIIIEHFKKYNDLFLKALDTDSPLAVKVKALDWMYKSCEDVSRIYGILEVDVNPYDDFGYNSSVWNLVACVLGAALDKEPEVRLKVTVVFDKLVQAKLVYAGHFYQIGELVLEKLGDPDTTIRSGFVKLFSYFLPVIVYLFGSPDAAALTPGTTFCKIGNRHNLHWRHVFALKQMPQRLQQQQLVSILSYISQRWKAPLSSWIQRFIQLCSYAKDSTQGLLEETGSSGENSLWMDVKVGTYFLERSVLVNDLAGVWWAIHEAARYCTGTRLRTNLGGPTQTFAALERMLLDIAHVLQLDAEHTDGNVSVIGSSGARLLPMRLLLDFVEALKKNVYNAYEGSFVLPSVTRQSSLFFRANKKVCEEWFSRICEPMMNAGLALQCHDATIQYCSLRLQELKISVISLLRDKSRAQVVEIPRNVRDRLSGDVVRIVRHITLALSKKHDPAALVGLQKWLNLTFSLLFEEETQFSDGYQISGPFAWITGLVYQAAGQYEKAAAFFTQLLQAEETLASMGSDGIQFTIGRVIESYTAISDWESLEAWLLELQALRAKHAGKSYSGALTTAGNEINAIHALGHFDDGDVQSAWASLDLTSKSSSELTLDPKLALQRSEQMLLQGLLHKIEGKIDMVPDEMHKAKSMLGEVLTVLPLDSLSEAAPFSIHLHCICALEEHCRLNQTQEKPKESVTTSLLQAAQLPMNVINQDCNSWLKLFRVYKTILPVSPVTLHLCKNMIHLSRKQRNLGLANRLRNYLKDQINSCSEISCNQFLVSSLRYEEILLMFSENKLMDAYSNMWSYVSSCFLSPEHSYPDADDSLLKAKACLKFSTWLKQDHPNFSVENIVLHILSDFNRNNNELTMGDTHAPNSSTHLVIEEIIGSAAKLSTRLCPVMGKSWISYASWCFSQAKESVSSSLGTVLHSTSFSSVLESELLPHRFSLTEDEISKVESIISGLFQKHSSSEDERRLWVQSTDEMISSRVKLLVQKVVNLIETAAGAPGVENFSGDSLHAAVNTQLRTVLLGGDFHIEEETILSSLSDLVNIWWSLRKRRVSLFGHAAHGFIQYLSHSSSKLGGFPSVDSGGSSIQKSGSLILRAVLYILHILLNYGLELKDTLESDLSAVPLLPWQEITPQLFARLGCHPETKIRKQLEGLLMMLAKSSPWSIVYPTLVDLNTSSEQPSEELEHILDCLTKLYPKLVQDVKLMIYELGNVTVLWEELWLSTLQDLHGDVMRRVNLLKEEAFRIAQNVNLSNNEKVKINAAKYSAMMAPIVVALERRLALISRKPETPHEKWFQTEYKELIKSAITAFKTPPTSASALADVWRPFDSIAASLASYQRKSRVSLQEVAPQLASLSSSDIPMPGLEKQMMISETERDFCSSVQGIVSVSSFSDQVTVLSTKTKPKKLVMVGSDGEKYTYLLKGREDLRLDARIMQLLQAVNRFLLSHSETKSCSIGIRYYSVTPISGRAGLIQWVDNVISIYSIFKSWQQRVQLAQLLATSGGNLKSTVPPPVPRPSDMFYGKIIPALKEKGIKRVISRRDWPHEVKLKVLLDLMEETPKQVLHQELWCASEGFGAFSSKLKRYSGSLAAMSMVGHILGLGDRHLDNILIDLSSGDIIHIDYNVCFDKGQRLKVPEIVPFRLTQTLEAALGLTGIEGVFRSNCEAVIGVLKRNKDILLMLLEVFIWDPLVEWMRGDFHDDAAIGGEERKGMELAVSLSLFASRVQEIRVPLQEHHDILLGSAPAVESALERFLSILSQYEIVSAIFYRADQERATLLHHETSAKSLVAEATSQLDKARALYEVQAREFSQAKTVVTEKAQEATTWLDQHGRVLDALRSDSISEIKFSVKLASMENSLSLISAVSVAGVPLTIVPEPTQAQCCEIDKEVSHLISELDHGVSCAITSLQNYSLTLLRFLPLNYIASSSLHSWAQVLQLSVNALSPDMILLARRQAGELIAKVHGDTHDFVRHSRDDLSLKMKRYALEIERLEEEYAGLLNSIGSEAESKAKERLLSAFMKYMQSSSFGRNEDLFPSPPPSQGNKDVRELDLKKEKMFSVLSTALCSLYEDVKYKVLDILNNPAATAGLNAQSPSDLGVTFCGLEEQIGKCVLVRDFVDELCRSVGNGSTTSDLEASEESWASIFKATLISCHELFVHMTELILPEVIKSIVSIDSEVMDAFGAVSAIRGSIETALEQLLEVEVERGSLEELEKSYFVKVGLITEQQLALEEAAIKGRDHLSWEEAEELASQEEACREQLDQLHHTWNQKDARSSSLIQKEALVKDALASSERQFLSLLDSREERMVHGFRSKALLSLLAKPFSGLESMDKTLFTYYGPFSSTDISTLADSFNSGRPVSEYIWKFKGLLNGSDFFAWKVAVMDMVLDLTVHNVSSSVDQNLGMDELISSIKKKLAVQLQVVINQYLKERIAPTFFGCLEKEIENLNQQTERVKELGSDRLKKDNSAVRKLKAMVEEYCDAHETVRAARSAASLMQRQVTELKEGIRRASQEIMQIEWMHDVTLSPSNDSRFIAHKYLDGDDKMYSHVLNISRPSLLESMQSAVSKIANIIENLKSCERTSVTAEGQLERAMNWACGGPSSGNSSNKNSGIPPEFHDHLKRRRQLLWEAQEKASDIMKVSLSVLEFEASRDGILCSPGEIFPYRTSGDGRAWQQAYLNALTRLELAFHSFARAEKEYKVAQSSMEAASNGLIAASNELSMVSLKSKSTSDDLQSTLLQMRDCAHETSIALSGFSRAARGHTALTSECGSMLEEVLAITDGLHDVHNLGKEAAAVHRSLMECISKACEVIFPLESVLSKDVAAMTDAMNKERETKKEISPIHGQAIYQSYCPRLKTAFVAFKPLVPLLMSYVKELYSLVTKLAQSASLHAGDLHKVTEAIEGSQEADTQEIDLSAGGTIENVPDFDNLTENFVSVSEAVKDESVANINPLSSQEREWISPPDSIYSSSESDTIPGEASPSNGLSLPEAMDHLSIHSNHEDEDHKPLPSETDHQENLQLGLSQSNNEVEIKDEDFGSSSDALPNDLADGVSSSSKSAHALPDTLEQGSLGIKLDSGDEGTSGTRVGAIGESQNDQVKKDGVRVTRGKNAFAMSVLRRIEMKLDGRDISENRNISIGEQVDYLLKQATSADNLCNMYEGWTPWI